MRSPVKQLFVLATILLLQACHVSQSIEEIEQDPPDRQFFTAQTPTEAISTLALVANGVAGPTELLDQAAGRLVITQRQPVYGNRLSTIVIRAKESSSGNTALRAWARGVNPMFGPTWLDRLWTAYSERMTAQGVDHGKIGIDADSGEK